MKKLNVLGASLLAATLLVGCGTKNTTEDTKTIKVVATANPQALILEQAKPILKDSYGYDLDIIVSDDYYMPNEAVNNGDADANYFQHVHFFEESVKDNNYDLVNVGGIHIEPFGFYSKSIKDLKDLKDGSTIVVSNSVADNGRILKILEGKGLITLKNGVNAVNATFNDIEKNPLNLKFKEVKPELLVTAFENQEGDLVAINGNFAIQGGLNPKQDAVLLESASQDSPYINIIAVKKGHENDDKIKALMEVLKSDEIKQYIENTWSNGSVIPAEK